MLNSQFSRQSSTSVTEKPVLTAETIVSAGPVRQVNVTGLTSCEHAVALDQSQQMSLAHPFNPPCDQEKYTRSSRESDLLASRGERVPSQYDQCLRAQSVLVGDPIGGSSRNILGYQAYPRASVISDRALQESALLEQAYGSELESTICTWAPCGCYNTVSIPRASTISACDLSACNLTKVPAFSKAYTIARQEAHRKGALVMGGLRVQQRSKSSSSSNNNNSNIEACICKQSPNMSTLSSFVRSHLEFPCVCALSMHSADASHTMCLCTDVQHVVPPACVTLHSKCTDSQGQCLSMQLYFILSTLRMLLLRDPSLASDLVASLSKYGLASPQTYPQFSRIQQPQIGLPYTFPSDAVFLAWLLGSDTAPCVEAEHVRPRPQEGTCPYDVKLPYPPNTGFAVNASSGVAVQLSKLHTYAPVPEEAKSNSQATQVSPGVQWQQRTLIYSIYPQFRYFPDNQQQELTADHAEWLLGVIQQHPKQIQQYSRESAPLANSILSPKQPSSSPQPRLLPAENGPTSSLLLSVLAKCPQKWVTSDAITQTFLTIQKSAIDIKEPTYSHFQPYTGSLHHDSTSNMTDNTSIVDIGTLRTPTMYPSNSLSRITVLDVSHCTGQTTLSFANIAYLSTLQKLDLSFCPGLTDGMLALIQTDKLHLRHLNISSCANLTGLVVSVLAYSQLSLESLDLSNLALSDAAMTPLLQWTEIEKGKCMKPAYRDQGERPFFLSKLVTFKCAYNSSLTQAGLMWLRQCPLLSEQNQNCTDVSDFSFLVTNLMPLNADGWAHANEHNSLPHVVTNTNLSLESRIYTQFPFLHHLSIANLTIKPHSIPYLHVHGQFPLLEYLDISKTYTGGTQPAGLLNGRLKYLSIDFTDLSEDGAFNITQALSTCADSQILTEQYQDVATSQSWVYEDIAYSRVQLNTKHAPTTASQCYCHICQHAMHPQTQPGSINRSSVKYYYPSKILNNIEHCTNSTQGITTLKAQGQYISTYFLQWILQQHTLRELNQSDCCTRDMRSLYYNSNQNTQKYTSFPDSQLQLDYIQTGTQVPQPLLEHSTTDFTRRGENPQCHRYNHIGTGQTGSWRALWYGGCILDHSGVTIHGQGGAAAGNAYGDVEAGYHVQRLGAQDLLLLPNLRKVTFNGCLIGTCGLVAWVQCIEYVSIEGSQLEHEWSHLGQKDRQILSSRICSWVSTSTGNSCSQQELGSTGAGDDLLAVQLMDQSQVSSGVNSYAWWTGQRRLGLSASCITGVTVQRQTQQCRGDGQSPAVLRSVSFTGNMQLSDQDVISLASSGKQSSSQTHVSLATTGATVKALSLLAVARHMCCLTMFGCTSRGTKEMVENIPAHVVLGYPGKLQARKLHQALPKHMSDGDDEPKADWCDGEQVQWRTETGGVRVENIQKEVEPNVVWRCHDALETWRPGTEGGGTKACHYMTGANVASSALVMTIEELYRQYITPPQ